MKEYAYTYVQVLADRLDEAAGSEVRRQILAGTESLTNKTPKQRRAAMLKTVMERMEALLDPETAVRVRMSCACKPPSFLKDARALLAAAPDIPAFLEAVERKRYLGSPLRYDGKQIRGDFGFRQCVCAKVSASKEPLPMMWCECCKGHVVWMYESLFNRPLRVEFTETVITGGAECRYIVTFD
jgi:hypothetical protein